jgi:hypothetical protein
MFTKNIILLNTRNNLAPKLNPSFQMFKLQTQLLYKKGEIWTIPKTKFTYLWFFVWLLLEVTRMMQHWLNHQLSFIKWKWWFNLFFQKSNYKWPSSSWSFKREKTSWQNHSGITTILQRAQLPMKHF